MQSPRNIYEFGPFRLDPVERLLLCDGRPLGLPPKAFDTLRVLVERRGHLVTKEELLKTVWPDSFVEESNLALNVHTLRKMLGGTLGTGPQYIETVPKQGYRFVGEVVLVPDDAVLIVEKHTATRIRSEEELEIIPSTTESVAVKTVPLFRRSQVGVLVAVVLGLGLGTALFLYPQRRDANPAVGTMPIKTLAVLPFTESAARDGNYLGLGLTDSLIARLSNSKQLLVRPTSAVRNYTDPDRQTAAIGQALKVQGVLDGSIQRTADQIHVTTHLVRVEDGATLWAASFDDKVSNIFALEDRLYQQVALALILQPGHDERLVAAKRQTERQEAYQEYLKGLFFWNKRTDESFKKAIGHFQSAIALDPNYALAYSGLGDSYLLLGLWGAIPPRQAMPKAKEAAAKALALDDTLAEAHTTLAFALLSYDWNAIAAEQEFQRALELNPGYATAHHWHAYNLAAMQRLPEALTEIQQAKELDPLSLSINADVGEILYWAGNYDEAIAQCQKTLEMDENFHPANFVLGYAYERKGLYAEAIKAFEKAATHSSTDSWTMGILGRAYGIFGKRVEAQKLLSELIALSHERYVSSYDLALIYLGLGEKDEAFRLLEKACDERAGPLAFIKTEPFFVGLRADPRFAALLHRMESTS